MENKKRLFVDMDGTLAKFHDEVKYLERMYEKGFFQNLHPFENMVAGIKLFIEAHPDTEVFILSAKVIGEPPYCEAEKNAWLDQYLPEIDRAHRIFPEVGTPKADSIPGGLTENDYLLDDYNKGLSQFLVAGGRAVKCHNNINQHGLGSYGGEAGHLWIGPMVHVDDKPELIAAELAKHMGLAYDLERVADAYGIALDDDAQNRAYPALCAQGEEFSAEIASGCTTVFENPLNALRYLSGKGEFLEHQIEAPDGQRFAVTEARLADINTNLGFPCNIISPQEAWRQQVCEILSRIAQQSGNQIHVNHTQPAPKAPDVVYLYELQRCGNKMGCPTDFKNVYYANWYEFFACTFTGAPYMVDKILEFTEQDCPLPWREIDARKKAIYEKFAEQYPTKEIIVLPIFDGDSHYPRELLDAMKSSMKNFKETNRALQRIKPAFTLKSIDSLSADATTRAAKKNAQADPAPTLPETEKEADRK